MTPIGLGDTIGVRPQVPEWVNGYAKGVHSTMVIRPRITGLTYISDTFNNLDDWVTVYGELTVTGGVTSDVTAPQYYSAARHKTAMLTDNHRATVVVNNGLLLAGESRVLICADENLNSYYGISIETLAVLGVRNDHISIIRGRNNVSVDVYQRTQVNIDPGDEFSVWYHRLDSTVRIYHNSILIAEQYFPPTDIPHGPNSRYIGIVPGCDFMRKAGKIRANNGVKFAALYADDVLDLPPVIHDPVDKGQPADGWVELSPIGLRVWRNPFLPPSLGADHLHGADAAASWDTPLNTDSARVAFEIVRLHGGLFTLMVRSTSNLSSGIGVQFDATQNIVYAVKSVGISGGLPTLQKIDATEVRCRIGVNTWQFRLTYNDATNTLRLYRGASRVPILTWIAGANFSGSDRYVGCVWNTSLLFPGIELTALDAFDVDPVAPLGS